MKITPVQKELLLIELRHTLAKCDNLLLNITIIKIQLTNGD